MAGMRKWLGAIVGLACGLAAGGAGAAEAAPALRMGTEFQVRHGTVSEPPPMPNKADIQPMTVPAMPVPIAPGR